MKMTMLGFANSMMFVSVRQQLMMGFPRCLMMRRGSVGRSLLRREIESARLEMDEFRGL